MVTITGLFYYPIKGCKGTALDTATLTKRGIAFDRHFMIVNPEGRFLTQRELPAMATIMPSVNGSMLTLAKQGMETLSVLHTDEPYSETSLKTVVVWDSVCKAVSQGGIVADWLSTALGENVGLVAMQRDFHRELDAEYRVSETDTTGFADGYPMLLVSEASLESLNSRLIETGSEPVPMNRFRPNIVVSGCEAFAEDTWTNVVVKNSAGDVPMYGVKPCGRCIVTTIDQETGTKTGAEPVATLKKFRRNADGTKVLFGQNVIHARLGQLSVGDVIEVHS